MRKNPKILPEFRDESEERDFWAKHSPLEYAEASSFRNVSFPNLRPSSTSISIRLPAHMQAEIKTLANKKEISYQALMKVYLARGIAGDRPPLGAGKGVPGNSKS